METAAAGDLPLIIRLINVGLIIFLAWLIYRLSWRLAGLFLRFYEFSPSHLPAHLQHHTGEEGVSKLIARLIDWLPGEIIDIPPPHEQRRQTLQEIISSAISVIAFVLAGLAILGQFAPMSTIVTVTGLLISALAFAGRTVIADYLAGFGILFQDQFYVGEKIKVKAQLDIIEGTVEQVSLNATWLRSLTGEVYVIANGEMRWICNYSRGIYSAANITLKIAAADLQRTVPLLETLGQEAPAVFKEMHDPWQVISESGLLAEHVEITLAVRAHFGQAVHLRPKLLALIQARLAREGIELVS
ncbi:MAG: mechanosensitive ion channel [Anaerolineaceae bacterium]|nr:mechanosensitive ion channel [Anaerolineaceae bacterium]MCB9099155.1 mechanosensitive ion channel [Anaerolineales bacterium]